MRPAVNFIEQAGRRLVTDFKNGWRTVVKAGYTHCAMEMSSNPTIDICSGTAAAFLDGSHGADGGLVIGGENGGNPSRPLISSIASYPP